MSLLLYPITTFNAHNIEATMLDVSLAKLNQYRDIHFKKHVSNKEKSCQEGLCCSHMNLSNGFQCMSNPNSCNLTKFVLDVILRADYKMVVIQIL
jgi:hypothetical protein